MNESAASTTTVRELKKISIIVPMYNEEDVLELFFTNVVNFLLTLNIDYEIICVDDGSHDRTMNLLLFYRKMNNKIKIISLSRNFGKESAMTAGLDYCSGDVVVPLDADLQDPPHIISRFIEKWECGYDVVYGIRKSRRGETPIKKGTAYFFYRIFNAIAEQKIPEDTGDFRLMDRKVIVALRSLPERNRFMKGIFSWVGFKQTGVEYEREVRAAGVTKWRLARLWNFALEGITGFSNAPLRVWSYIGVVISLLAFVYASFLILRTLLLGVDVPGYPSLLCVVLFLGGIQLISLGVMGEYLGRTYNEVKQRPIYLIRDTLGIDNSAED